MTSTPSKATAGPWKLFQFGGPQIGNANTGEAVCTMLGNEKNKNDSIHANAALIAAAPDLLAACQEFVRKVETGEAKSTKSYAQMKAAISRATGEA